MTGDREQSIEAAAEALFNATFNATPLAWDNWHEPYRDEFRARARAVIAASGLVERVSSLEAALAKAQAMKVALLDEFGAHALSDATLDAVLLFEVVYRGLVGLADESAGGS